MSEIAEERLRIAREMHDGIAQEVAALGYRIDEVIGNEGLSISVREELRLVRAQISALSYQVRDDLFALRDLPVRPFQEAVASVIALLGRSSEIEIEIDLQSCEPKAPRFELLRIIQETVLNAIRHSGATAIKIAGDKNGISIADNGRGIGEARSGAFGIAGLRERAANIECDFTLTSNSTGTKIALRW
ncbi:MAG: histidine kinase [Actinomycetes bacterium]